jgi:ADP-ribose pyrophosphatase YjhB (NUDIX family)
MSETFPRVGSALLVRDEANRILLGQRNKDPQRGAWVIPGGKIHAFESVAEAAARELEEETGLKVEVRSQFKVYEIINPPDEHRIVIYSWGKVVGGSLKASDDLSDVKFFSVDELGEVLTTPLVSKVLADAGLIPGKEKATPGEHVQLTLWLPILLAGANEHPPTYMAHAARPRRRRRRVVLKSPLLFDIRAGT